MRKDYNRGRGNDESGAIPLKAIKTGNPRLMRCPEAAFHCRFPNGMTLTQGALMLLTQPNPKT
jgi:hypothetical protein